MHNIIGNIEWGSVADWVSGLGTISAVLVALRKPREQFLFTINDNNEMKIENIAPVKSQISVRANKFSDSFNQTITLDRVGDPHDYYKMYLPFEYKARVKIKFRIYNFNTGQTTKIKVIITPIKHKNGIQTSEVKLYRSEFGIYRQEYNAKIKVNYDTFTINDSTK